jgi:WD40 repeat protein
MSDETSTGSRGLSRRGLLIGGALLLAAGGAAWKLFAGGRVLRSMKVADLPLRALALNRAGNLAVVGGDGRTLQLWDVAGGKLAQDFAPTSDTTSALRLSGDEAQVLCCNWSNQIELRNAADGKLITTYSGHSDDIFWVDYMPDGKTFISASDDNSMRIWDIASGSEVRALDGNAGVRCFAITPDGKQLLSGGQERMVKLWDLAAGSVLGSWWGHADTINCIVVSPDGKTALSGAQDKTIRVWDIAGASSTATLEDQSSEINTLALSADGKLALAGSEDGMICLWDLAKNAIVGRLQGHRAGVSAVAFMPGETQAVSAGKDGYLLVWDLTGLPAA